MWRHFLHHTHARCGEFQIHPHLPCEDILNFSKCGEILEIYTSIIWRNQKFLHMTDFFSTNIICDICDKYEVWSHLSVVKVGLENLKLLHMLKIFKFLHNRHTWRAENSPHGNFSPLIRS